MSMINIMRSVDNVHDENGTIIGFLTIKELNFYDTGYEYIPSDTAVNPRPPCLVLEVIDEEYSTAEQKLLKPIDWIGVTDAQAAFIKKHFGETQ